MSDYKDYRNVNKNANRGFIDSAVLNSATFINYLERLKLVACSMFEWINLPSSMNAEFLERCLYEYGKAALLKTKKYGFINSKCCSNGDLNIYMLPTSLNCYSTDSLSENRKLYNGFKDETISDYEYCVLVKNTYDMIPTESTLELFALRLYEAERTCDVNIKAQKTPTIILGDESLRVAMKNLFLKYDGNEPVIYADKKQIGADTFKVLTTEAPFIADKIMEYKKQIWNEALTYLGINSLATEKKERLITDEANSNNELINLNLQARLLERKKACKQFNELFGLTGENAIDVRVRSDLRNIIKNLDSSVNDIIDSKGGENIVKLYNDIEKSN